VANVREMRRPVAPWLLFLALAIASGADGEPGLRVRTLAGPGGGAGHRDASGRNARFASPVRLGAGCDGALVLADASNHTIRRISDDGAATTLAGSPYVRGASDGTSASALFDGPEGIAVAPDCSIWVADTGNNTIRRIASSGVVSTIAGAAGSVGPNDGTGSSARFDRPVDIAFDPVSGDAFVVDAGNVSIRRVTQGGKVTTLAAPSPTLNQPSGIAFEPGGRMIVTELYGNAIRFRRSDGAWSRLTFKPTAYPSDAFATAGGSIYVTDMNNSVIWEVPTQGAPVVVAGTYAKSGATDGAAAQASFFQPRGIAPMGPSTFAIADSRNSLVRTFDLSGRVGTLAGQFNARESIDGARELARFRAPRQATEGPDGTVYVADGTVVRKVSSDGVVTTLAGVDGVTGSADGKGSEARFMQPFGVAVGPGGVLFVSDVVDHTLRRIAPDGTVTTIAGKAGTPGSIDGASGVARFFDPYGIATDRDGNIFVADRGSHAIRRVAAADFSVSTIAGALGVIGSGDGPALQPRFFNPWDVDVDDEGIVYVLDENNHCVQKIEGGTVTTLANTHQELRSFGVAVAGDGTIYVAESQSSAIRRATLAGGEPFMGARLEPGNRVGSPSRARFSRPNSVDIGPGGRFVIADTENGSIKVAELVEGPWIDELNAIRTSTLPGSPVTLEWCTDGASTVTLSPGPGSVAPCGSTVVTPAETTTYTLEASSAGASIRQSVTVTVVTQVRRRAVRR